MEEEIAPVIGQLTNDLRDAAKSLSQNEARFLVDTYYTMQDQRIRAANQSRALTRSGEPPRVVEWLSGQSEILEQRVRSVLHSYAKHDPHGRWALGVHGIGPVISAGLLAHIDMENTNHASRIYSYAGLAPGIKWEKGQKRPWNAELKTLCFKIGDSFRKQSSNEKCFYGHKYLERKEIEVRKNENGELKAEAERALSEKSWVKDTKAKACYEKGELPPAHLDARARRWAVKLFLSHWFEVGYYTIHKERPPAPYAIAHQGHADRIDPPNPPWAAE